MLVPHLAAVVIERVLRVAGVVEIRARARASDATCPGCGTISQRVHAGYERRLSDLAVAGQPMRIVLAVRRFKCVDSGCARATFVEQVADLTTRHGRHTVALRRALEAIGLALAGRAGARLAARLGLRVHRTTLLRLVRALPDPDPGAVTGVGVDDFALRRGHRYGTVIIDIDSHRPLDVLADRTSDTLAAWLREHPDLQVVCRDRAGAYADAARTGAPQAIQVADRWHLWHNLTEAVAKTVAGERTALRAAPDTDASTELSHSDDTDATPRSSTPAVPLDPGEDVVDAAPEGFAVPEGPLVVRTRERHAAVIRLRADGYSITHIARELGLNRRTVRRFARADRVEDLLGKAASRGSLLDPYKPYLHERFNAGQTDAAALTAEITERGYRGSAKTVRRYLHPFRAAALAPPPTPIPPTVRAVTGWMTCHPDRLDTDDSRELAQILDRSTVLATTRRQVGEFAEMLTGRHGERLDDWMRDIDATGAPPLRSFANGLRSDLDAVTNGLTMPHNSGPVEGTVTRIKTLKRQMYGRANFDLLRKRILHPV